MPRPAPESDLGVHYDTAWSRKYPVRLARAMVLDNVTRPLAKVVAQPQLRGEEYLADLERPVIFASNHASHIDTPLLLASLPLRFRHRTVVAAAADYFFDRRWKADTFSFLLGAIPIERTKVNRRSADLAAELIADDWNLVIFPEGGRSPDGWAQQFTGGAAYLASRTGRPVVPVHLDGHPPHPAQGWGDGEADPDHGHLRHPAVAGRGRERPPVQPSVSRRRWPPWPTSRPPTGGRPASWRPPVRLRRCRDPTSPPGAGRGRSQPAPGPDRSVIDAEGNDWPRTSH